jgi:hypothetical protein
MKRQVIALAALTLTVMGSTGVGFAAPAKKADAPKAAAKAKVPEKAKVAEKKAPTTQVAAASVPGEEVVYKIKLRGDGSGSTDDTEGGTILGIGSKRRSSWAVVRVNGNQVNILHSTRLGDLIGRSRWFDHKVIAIRMCDADSFDTTDSKKNCKSVKSDTIELPAGKSLYDVSFDFRYVEGGAPYINTLQITPELQPEPPEGQKNCKNGMELCLPK